MALDVIRIEISPENLFFNINHKSLLLRDNIRASETSVQINKIVQDGNLIGFRMGSIASYKLTYNIVQVYSNSYSFFDKSC
jgi:hypothetical protein